MSKVHLFVYPGLVACGCPVPMPKWLLGHPRPEGPCSTSWQGLVTCQLCHRISRHQKLTPAKAAATPNRTTSQKNSEL